MYIPSMQEACGGRYQPQNRRPWIERHENEVLLDIVGCDKNKEKGIVDSADEEEFVAKVDSLVAKWNSLEKGIFPAKEPQFANYFRDHTEEDMKEGTLLPTRRKAGLKDDFFYNNAQECSNFKYKCKIKELKLLRHLVTALI